MRIAVARTGGFAGIARRGEVETAGHPDAARLESLARAVLAAGEGPREAVVPDGFCYTITVDGRTVHCADPALTDAQRALVRAVLGG